MSWFRGRIFAVPPRALVGEPCFLEIWPFGSNRMKTRSEMPLSAAFWGGILQQLRTYTTPVHWFAHARFLLQG